jgi:hypothetical protein
VGGATGAISETHVGDDDLAATSADHVQAAALTAERDAGLDHDEAVGAEGEDDWFLQQSGTLAATASRDAVAEQCAVAEQRLGAARAALAAQRAEDGRRNTPLTDAIRADHTAAAELLAKHGGAHGSSSYGRAPRGAAAQHHLHVHVHCGRRHLCAAHLYHALCRPRRRAHCHVLGGPGPRRRRPVVSGAGGRGCAHCAPRARR